MSTRELWGADDLGFDAYAISRRFHDLSTFLILFSPRLGKKKRKPRTVCELSSSPECETE